MNWLKMLKLRSRHWKEKTWSGDDIPFLIDAFRASGSPESKIRILTILGQIKDPGTLGIFVDSLGADDSLLRQEAAIALGKIGSNDPAVVRALIESLDTEDYFFRIEVVKALAKTGNKDVIAPLIISYAKSRGRNGALAALCSIDKDWEKTPKARLAANELRKALVDDNTRKSWETYDAKVVGFLRRNHGSTREPSGNLWQMEECRFEMFLRAACMLEAIEGGEAEKYLTLPIVDLMSDHVCEYIAANDTTLASGKPGSSKRDRIVFARCEEFRRELKKLRS
jgi:hypothetical protein